MQQALSPILLRTLHQTRRPNLAATGDGKHNHGQGTRPELFVDSCDGGNGDDHAFKQLCCTHASGVQVDSGAALQLLSDNSSESYGAVRHPLREPANVQKVQEAV